MADTEALESLAELLPPERRERFFTIVRKFRNLPEDDDHLQMLEAVGFVMLIMKEIPSEIAGILAQAQRTLGETESEKLREEVTSILTSSLDTPSYKDLRETVSSIRDQEARFRHKVDDVDQRLTEAELTFKSSSRIWPQFINGLTGGLIGSLVVGLCVGFAFEYFANHRSSGIIPEALRPYAELQERGKLDYFESHIPDLGGDVQMYLISGNVVRAFQDGDHGIVVCRSPEPAK